MAFFKNIFDADSGRMFIVSMAALFVELILIRWIGTEVRIFSYMQNLALITCFLGFGVGCLISGEPKSLMTTLACLCALNLIVSLTFVVFLRSERAMDLFLNFLTLSPDAALWGSFTDLSTSAYIVLLGATIGIMTLFLWLIAATMVPLGCAVGRCFDKSPNVVRAYSVNLFGSLIGTWLLLGLSFMRMSPAYWFLLAFLLVLLAMPKSKDNWLLGGSLFVLIVCASLIVYSWKGVTTEIVWSPYQKLQVVPASGGDESFVYVNNTGYMTMANTTPAYLQKHPDIEKTYRDGVYDSPFRFLLKNADVLIVGAGAGNDVSAALRNGAAHVDAVEIDPAIYDLGKKMHPDKPYDSNKVRVIINDARNFFRLTQSKYDAIIFGLLDSHTGFSGYSNMRVDNYVYTKEAFAQARQLLKPEGVLVLKFEVRKPWLWMGERFARTLSDVFGREPIVYFAPKSGNMWPGTVFLESAGKDLWQKAKEPKNKKFIESHPVPFSPASATAPKPATDDWPYVYHRDRSIPRTYLTVSALLLVVSFFMVGKSFVPTRKSWPPFFLGAGFLLMETQLISRLGLYFGSTWIVNSIAISTILCVLMLANVFLETRRKPLNLGPFYGLLIVTLGANYFFPWNDLPFTPRVTGLLLSAAYAVSVFLAGVIFSATLQGAKNKSQTLGSNVLGSVAGGLMQNLSFVVGLKALLLLAALSYGGSALLNRSSKT